GGIAIASCSISSGRPSTGRRRPDVRTVRRGGDYLRVADHAWAHPLDGRFSALRGGRWNPPGSFPVVYLCRTVEVARAVLYQKLAQHPYGPEDLDPVRAPVLVATVVRDE